MLHCSFALAAAQLLVKRTSALQKSQCCSATSAAQHSENCSETSILACGMFQEAPQYQEKGCSRKRPPSLCFFLWGRLLEHCFLEHFCCDQLSVIQGKFCIQRFSNTSFGGTLLSSNFGGLLPEQTFCRHFAAFPMLQGWGLEGWGLGLAERMKVSCVGECFCLFHEFTRVRQEKGT